ncbi:MAG: DUF3800 domain-containing protein [Ignavibacteriales bacterium]|nr:DUF3800 domain-containing protein [Ignavibacteriales bacterium]
MPYKIYIDESGDHTYSDVECVSKRYLSLLGVIIKDTEHQCLVQRFNAIKKEIWAGKSHLITFHRDDIIYKKKLFSVLLDKQLQSKFDNLLLDSFSTTNFKMVSVTIDKKNHLEQYKTPNHPYHYCTEALMGRYVGLLRFLQDTGVVFAESRGENEDAMLQDSFNRFYRYGNIYFTPEMIQKHLLSQEIAFYPKIANIAGLELSDMLANPIKRYALHTKGLEKQNICGFTEKPVEATKKKFNKRYTDSRIEGYGMVYLSCIK